ncbi:Secreted RxLR effector peptide protein [Phytophthora palmivora]|uniref:Secreted RxLR effector peptide protein n=1 Tax=Phytophthora palmivora TaxID=4796 RepID=A0A2P4Y258_9STRA|nr:Secreted RxLR effector peptide protein [Phytophthora palmivora]
MRLLRAVLLGAVTFTSVDAFVTTSKSSKATLIQDDIPSGRLLRVSSTIDLDTEERGIPSGVTAQLTEGLVSKITPAIASKLTTSDDELVKLLNNRVLPKDVFKSTLKLDQVDDLFTNPKLNVWINYMDDFNAKYTGQKTTLFKTLTQNFDDEKLSQMIVAAQKNPSTEAMANNLQKSQFNQWLLDKKTPDDVFKSLGLTGKRNLPFQANGPVWVNPKLSTWVNYMRDFNAKYTEQKTTLFKTLTQNFDDEKLSRMIVAAQKNPSTEAMANNLQKSQFNQWLLDRKTPTAVFKSLGLSKSKNWALDANVDVWKLYNANYRAQFGTGPV